MARLNPQPAQSEYYPPRARWYSRLLLPWFRFQRALHLEKIRLPVGFTTGQVILGLLVPGFALFVNGRRKVGTVFLAIFLLSLVCLIIWFGFPISGWGYGLMISVHASSIVFMESGAWRDHYPFQFRFVMAVLTLLAVWLAVYRPCMQFVQTHWATPVVMQGRVVVMRPVRGRGAVKPGERILYSIADESSGDAHGGGAVWIQSGFGWGPVLAMAGDRVNFSSNSFSVNGHARPSLPRMPGSGEVVVPEKHWFVWPELAISGHGNVGDAAISSAMLSVSVITEKQIVGVPYHRWFWRRQTEP